MSYGICKTAAASPPMPVPAPAGCADVLAVQALAMRFEPRQKKFRRLPALCSIVRSRLAVSGTNDLVPADSPDHRHTPPGLDIAGLEAHAHQLHHFLHQTTRQRFRSRATPRAGGASSGKHDETAQTQSRFLHHSNDNARHAACHAPHAAEGKSVFCQPRLT
jgi:hypothetical protein